MIKLLLVLMSIFTYISTFAGDLQGGGGGPQNANIKRYLDTRIYSLGGATKKVFPRVNVVNACKHQNTLNTINKVWVCEGSVNKGGGHNCTKKIKKHLKHKLSKVKRKCLDIQVKKDSDGKFKNVCEKWGEKKIEPLKLTYSLDVYRRNIGEGGTPLYPKPDSDTFLRTIQYHIPNCNEIVTD